MNTDCLEKIKNNISGIFSDGMCINFDFFEKFFCFLSGKGGFEKLFNNMITNNLPETICSITEFNFIAQILRKHPNVQIEYEPKIFLDNGIIAGEPDFRVLFKVTTSHNVRGYFFF